MLSYAQKLQDSEQTDSRLLLTDTDYYAGFYSSILCDSYNNIYVGEITKFVSTEYGTTYRAYAGSLTTPISGQFPFSNVNFLKLSIAVNSKEKIYGCVDQGTGICFSDVHNSSVIKAITNSGIDSLTLKINSTNAYNIIFTDSTTHKIARYYTSNLQSSWLYESIPNNSDECYYSSFFIDVKDGLHICYYDANKSDLKYLFLDKNGWNLTTIESIGDVGRDSSITVDNLLGVHVAYINTTGVNSGNLKYAFKPLNGTWQNITLGKAIDKKTSICVDNLNNTHIAYFNDAGLSYFNISNNKTITNRTIYSNHADYQSITVDKDRTVYISFQDQFCNFVYAKNCRGSDLWKLYTIDAYRHTHNDSPPVNSEYPMVIILVFSIILVVYYKKYQNRK